MLEHIKDYVRYDENSPSGLIWIRINKGSNRKLFDVAGGLDESTGYWKVCILNNRYKAHRVVWYLFNGSIDSSLHIDHIDGNPLNNKIENLRLVPPELNSRNRTKNYNNSTGVTGISYHEGFTRKGTYYSKFCAVYNSSVSTRKQKTFSIQKYGHEQAFQLACQWREQKIAELNEQGAGYSERHGK